MVKEKEDQNKRDQEQELQKTYSAATSSSGIGQVMGSMASRLMRFSPKSNLKEAPHNAGDPRPSTRSMVVRTKPPRKEESSEDHWGDDMEAVINAANAKHQPTVSTGVPTQTRHEENLDPSAAADLEHKVGDVLHGRKSSRTINVRVLNLNENGDIAYREEEKDEIDGMIIEAIRQDLVYIQDDRLYRQDNDRLIGLEVIPDEEDFGESEEEENHKEWEGQFADDEGPSRPIEDLEDPHGERQPAEDLLGVFNDEGFPRSIEGQEEEEATSLDGAIEELENHQEATSLDDAVDEVSAKKISKKATNDKSRNSRRKVRAEAQV